MNSLQSKFSFLLVDDDPNIISLLKSAFKDSSYKIYTALDGQSALDLMAKVRIDATLIDLVMPGMDGITLLKEIKKDYPETMAVMLSGYGSIDSAVKAVKLGAVDFFEKPVSARWDVDEFVSAHPEANRRDQHQDSRQAKRQMRAIPVQ